MCLLYTNVSESADPDRRRECTYVLDNFARLVNNGDGLADTHGYWL